MEHAKKIFLLDPNPLTSRHEVNSELDKAVQDILTRKDISEDRKLAMYQNVLLKFQGVQSALAKPLKMTMTQPDFNLQEVIESYPNVTRDKVLTVLERIKKSPHLNWNLAGELVHGNNATPNSNIKDLLNLLLQKDNLPDSVKSEPHKSKKKRKKQSPKEGFYNAALKTPRKRIPPQKWSPY